MTTHEMMNHITALKNVIRVSKCRVEDYVFTTSEPNVFYVVNPEKSLIKRIAFNNGLNGLWLPNMYHVVGAVSTYGDVVLDSDPNMEFPYPKHMIMPYESYNRFIFDGEYVNICKLCTEAINSLSEKLSQTPILDTTDMMNDTYYDYVYNTLFKMGTGRGDIIKTRTGVPITIYKGLVPYTSKDRVELWIHPVSDVEFITNYRVVKMKLTKNAPTLDLFLRSLNFYNDHE